MPEIGIHTTQNVVLTTEPASVAERMLSALLDYVFLGKYFVFIEGNKIPYHHSYRL